MFVQRARRERKPAVATSSPVTRAPPDFLTKLVEILESEECLNIICWEEGKIHIKSTSRLCNEILSKYFRQSKFSSFQRQLNYFGFKKLKGGGRGGESVYASPSFKEDDSAHKLLHQRRKCGIEATPSLKEGDNTQKILHQRRKCGIEADLSVSLGPYVLGEDRRKTLGAGNDCFAKEITQCTSLSKDYEAQNTDDIYWSEMLDSIRSTNELQPVPLDRYSPQNLLYEEQNLEYVGSRNLCLTDLQDICLDSNFIEALFY